MAIIGNIPYFQTNPYWQCLHTSLHRKWFSMASKSISILCNGIADSLQRIRWACGLATGWINLRTDSMVNLHDFFFLNKYVRCQLNAWFPTFFFPHQPDHPDQNYGRGKSWGWIAAAPRWIHQWWPGAVYTGLMAISIKEGWTWGWNTGKNRRTRLPDFQFLEIWYSINPSVRNAMKQMISVHLKKVRLDV